MGILVKRKKHWYTRVPVIVVAIGLFAISPILVSMAGAWLTEWITGNPCHEGNCFWGALGWLFLITIPASLLLLLLLVVILIYDLIAYLKK